MCICVVGVCSVYHIIKIVFTLPSVNFVNLLNNPVGPWACYWFWYLYYLLDHWRSQGSVPNGGKATRTACDVTPKRPVGCRKRRTDYPNWLGRKPNHEVFHQMVRSADCIRYVNYLIFCMYIWFCIVKWVCQFTYLYSCYVLFLKTYNN